MEMTKQIKNTDFKDYSKHTNFKFFDIVPHLRIWILPFRDNS